MASISKIANSLGVTDMKAFESFTRKMKLGRGVNHFIDNLTHIKGETPISNGNGYPRYLYHFTTRENATSIFQSGKLEARTNELFKGGGVCRKRTHAVQFQNFDADSELGQ